MNDFKNILKSQEIDFIKEAILVLENPSLLVQLTNVFGKPVEFIQKSLPIKLEKKISQTTFLALQKGLLWSISTLNKKQLETQSIQELKKQSRRYTFSAGVSGAVGGFFGWPGLIIELPISTLIMLRSIAMIADSNGEDVLDPEVQLECLQIFAFGSQKTAKDDEIESAYYLQRIGMTHMLQQAAKYIAKNTTEEVLRGLEKKTAPLLIKLLSRISSELEIVISEKILAESVPIVGAIGGVVVNTAFISYFNKIAIYHFGLRKLEKRCGKDAVYDVYLSELKKIHSN